MMEVILLFVEFCLLKTAFGVDFEVMENDQRENFGVKISREEDRVRYQRTSDKKYFFIKFVCVDQ
jgi:hypothetical protein